MRRATFRAAFFGGLILTIGTLPVLAISTETNELDSGREAAVVAGVGAALRDPDSARYRLPTVSSMADATSYCGCVNAKNGFGGYEGQRPFFGLFLLKGTKETFITSGTEPGDAVNRDMCSQHNLKVPC